MNRFRHDANRDTLWVGKGASPTWLIIMAILAMALIAWTIFH